MAEVFLGIISVFKDISEFASNPYEEYTAIKQSTSTYILV